jgi:hypothetical protein
MRLLIAASVLFGSSAVAIAQAPSTHRVERVAVDVAGATPLAARDSGILEGQRRAFRQLMERLAPAAEVPTLARVADGDLLAIVTGFEIDGERIAGNRWIAMMAVEFDAVAVERHLGSRRGSAPAATVGGPEAKQLLRAEIGDFDGYLDLRRRLARVPGVRAIGLRALSPSEALIELAHAGDTRALAEALSGASFPFDDADGVWVLRRGGAPPSVR